MSDWQVVLLKIGAMFLVIVAGWVARHRGYLAAETTSVLSRFVVDVTFPALVFTQMLRTVTLTVLREGWFVPLLGGGLIGLAYCAGRLVAPWFCGREQRNTFLFLAAIPNWIFLPLPIVEALYGDAGVRTIFLYNAGTQLTLWSFGIWILRGQAKVRDSVRNLATNYGLLATAAGIVVALAVPAARDWELRPAGLSQLVPGAMMQALAMVGSLTIPVSLLAIGAQLGGLESYVHRPTRALWGVLVARLLVGPALVALVGWACAGRVPEVPRMEAYLMATMPVAISCSMFTERFGGDVALSAQAIFYSTFCSLLTVPLIFFLIQRLGL